jgi:hypothetical protein
MTTGAAQPVARRRAMNGEAEALRRQDGPWWLVLFCGLARYATQATEADRGRAAPAGIGGARRVRAA